MLTKIKNLIRELGIYNVLLFFGLLLVNLFIHFYRLTQLPYGINVDEMGTGYDAWCIAHFGVDRFLKSFPVYFINYCDGQSALYTYLCAILIKFFHMPLSLLTIRLPIALFSCLTLFFGIQIIRLKYGNNMKMILAFTALYTVCPIFTTLHRMGFDCNLMLGLSTVFLYSLFYAVEKPSLKRFFVSGLLCGLVLYTYALSYFVLPLFLFGMLLYLIRLHKITLKQFLIFTLPLAILGFPLVLEQIVNMFDLSEIRLGFLTVTKMYRYRGEEFVLSTFFTNAVNVFKGVFFHDHLLFDTIPAYHTMYAFSVPFLLIGIAHSFWISIQAVKKREWNLSLPILLWALIELFMGCFLAEQPTRTYTLNGVFLCLLFLLIDGILISFHFIKKRLSEKISLAALAVLIVAYLFSFISFATYYFKDYQKDTYLIQLFNNPLDEPLAYLNTLPEDTKEKTTYIGNLDQTYIYYLSATLTSPYDYNRLEIEDSEHLYEWTCAYRNFNFNLPEKLDLNANYIIQDKDTDYLSLLKENHFTMTQTGHYYVCTSPLAAYATDNQIAAYTWNSGVSADNFMDTAAVTDIQGTPSLVLVGWAFNAETDSCFDDIFLVAGGHTYRPEIVERPDVVEMNANNQNLLNSGLLFIIPQADLADVTNATLICVDSSQQKKAEIPIQIQ